MARPRTPARSGLCCLGALCISVLASTACGPTEKATAAPGPATARSATAKAERRQLRRIVRGTGTTQPLDAVWVGVPQVSGAGNLVLTRIIPSGSHVKAGDVVAEFDRTRLLDMARDAEAKYDDLGHQLEQKKAQHRSDAEKRASDIQQAEADLSKARLELRRGPLLSEIDRLKNQGKLENAQAHLASLKKSVTSRKGAEAAELEVLALQRNRQKINMDRARNNADRLLLKAPLAGMVAHGVVWRNQGPGHPQEGDQLWSGQTLLRIFSAARMEVQVPVAEPDGAVLAPGLSALIRLDAYPELVFKARFDSASPVASAALDSPVRTFSARFLVDGSDPRLLPDLSAAVDIEVVTPQPVLVVPRMAVTYRGDKAYVTKVAQPGSQEQTLVTLGAWDDNFIEILSGLKDGDQILAAESEPSVNR